MNKVALYVRVSTLEQAESGYSVGEQTAKLTKYCEIKDWSIYEVYTDGGFSGSNTERPAMERLIKDAQSKKFDTILVYKLDRLSRSQKDTLYLIEEVFNKNDISFLSLNENFDTSSAFGKAMIGILSVFAQLEREQIKERMQLGKLGRAKTGKSMMWAKVAFGYEYHTETGTMTINPLQAEVVKQIFNEYLGGMSITKLRDKLNNEGFTGKERPWSYRTLRQTLDNPVYCGLVKYNDNLFEGLHEPIISKETFDKVQEEIVKRQKAAYEYNHNPRPFQAKYMLSGAARCGYCGAPLTSTLGSVRKDGTRTRKYQCKNRYIGKSIGVTVYNNNQKCDSGFYIMDDIEEKVIAEISKLQVDEKALKNLVADNSAPVVDTSAFEKQLKTIENKLKKLADLYMNDLLTIEELKAKTEKLQADKKVLQAKIGGTNHTKPDDTIKTIKSFIGKKPIYSLNYDSQKKIVNQLIDKVDVTAETICVHWKI